MNDLETLDAALATLRGVVAGLEDVDMDVVTNCEPWTVRTLASHAVKSQLLWVGSLTGTEIVSVGDVMAPVAYEDDLLAHVDDAIEQARSAWGAHGVLDAVHATAFGEMPGSAVVGFPTIDAFAHAWDIASSLGRSIDVDPAAVPGLAAVVEASCNDATRDMGLFAEPGDLPHDASDVERLVAAAGRTITR